MIFCMQINIKVFKKFILTLWASKFHTSLMFSLMCMIKHSQNTRSNNFAISLQNVKKEVKNGGHFWHADSVKVSTSLYYPFWWKCVGMFKMPKIGSWKHFCSILGKIVATTLCSIVMQNIQIFYGGPVMFIVTCWI